MDSEIWRDGGPIAVILLLLLRELISKKGDSGGNQSVPQLNRETLMQIKATLEATDRQRAEETRWRRDQTEKLIGRLDAIERDIGQLCRPEEDR